MTIRWCHSELRSVTRIQFLEIVPHFASAAIDFADIGKGVE